MIPLNYDVQLVTRAEWGARPPESVSFLSVNKVTSHWEGPHMGDFPHSSCATKVRGIQAFHMDSQGWSDIAYNALACPHGYAFEGRGRGRRSAANGTLAGNSGAYAVCYLGGDGDPFTEAGKRAMKAAGDWLTFQGSLRNGHRDWKPTACPGDDIYHWTHDGQPIIWLPQPPSEDDLSAEEVQQIIAHINDKGPYFAQVDGDPAVWVVYKGNGTKRWMQTQEMVAAARDDRVFAREVRPDGSVVPWGRSREHLEQLETVGPLPPGW